MNNGHDRANPPDVDPPPGFETEAKTLYQPVPFSILAFKQPDLLAEDEIGLFLC